MDFVKNILVPFLDSFKLKNPYLFGLVSLLLLTLNFVLVTDSETMSNVIPEAIRNAIAPVIGLVLWLLNLGTYNLRK